MVLDPEACALTDALRAFGVFQAPGWPPLVVDWDVCRLLATWHHARSELDAAVFLFSLINRIAPAAVPDSLREPVCALPEPEVADLAGASAQVVGSFARAVTDGAVDTLGVAIRLSAWAAAGTPDGHPAKSMLLSNLSASLRARFAFIGDPVDLEGAVTAGRRSVELVLPGDPERALILHNYSFALLDRSGMTGSAEDLDAAVDLGGQAAIMPEDAPYHAACLSNAGMTVMRRFELRGHLPDITEAVERLRSAARAAPVGNQVLLATFQANLAVALHARFRWLSDPAGLEAAVVEAVGAVRICPQGHPDAARCLTHLSLVLLTRFESSVDPAYADAAVIAARHAKTPDRHPLRAYRFDRLGSALRSRGIHRHTVADLGEAVRAHEQAVSAVLPGSAQHARYLTSLCGSRLALFEHTGQLTELDAAVGAGRLAVRGAAEDHDRSESLIALGAALRTRASHSWSADDVNEAVTLLEQAGKSIPGHHPAMVVCLSELGRAYSYRFEHTDDIADIDRSIAEGERSIELVGQHDPQRMDYLEHLAPRYRMRFLRTDNLDDLNTALDYSWDAIRTIPEEHDARAAVELDLGLVLMARFQRIGELADLDEAIRQMECARERAHLDDELPAIL